MAKAAKLDQRIGDKASQAQQEAKKRQQQQQREEEKLLKAEAKKDLKVEKKRLGTLRKLKKKGRDTILPEAGPISSSAAQPSTGKQVKDDSGNPSVDSTPSSSTSPTPEADEPGVQQPNVNAEDLEKAIEELASDATLGDGRAQVTFKVFDLGGQSTFYIFHPFFLTRFVPVCLFVCVCLRVCLCL